MGFNINQLFPRSDADPNGVDPDKVAEFKRIIAQANPTHGIACGDEGEPIAGFTHVPDQVEENESDEEEDQGPQTNIKNDFRDYLKNNDLLDSLRQAVPAKALYPQVRNALISIAAVLKKDVGILAKPVNKSQLAKLLSLNIKDELTCWEYSTQYGTLYFILSFTNLKLFYMIKPGKADLASELNLTDFSEETLYKFIISGIMDSKELQARHASGNQ
jgi:hypothetical protein